MTAIGKAFKESLAKAAAASLVLGPAGPAALAPAILIVGGRELFGANKASAQPVSKNQNVRPIQYG